MSDQYGGYAKMFNYAIYLIGATGKKDAVGVGDYVVNGASYINLDNANPRTFRTEATAKKEADRIMRAGYLNVAMYTGYEIKEV